MMFNELAILDRCEAVELLEITQNGKALIKRQPDKVCVFEMVDLSRIEVMPNKYCSLKELNDKYFRKEAADEG